MTVLHDRASALGKASAHPAALFSARRLALVLRFSSVQLLVQGFGFAAGIVVVRTLAQDQYGHYTLAVAMVGLCAVLLDLGLGSALLAVGGPYHDDPARLGVLLHEAFALQHRLALLLGAPLAAWFVWTLHQQGMALPAAALLVVLVAAITLLNVHISLWLVVLRLQRRLALQQGLELSVNAGRAAVLAGASLLYLDLWIGTLALLLASTVQFLLLRSRMALAPATADAGLRERLVSFVRRQAPNSIYYCFSAQITVWLVGWFGGAERVAEVGALGRLALLFALIGAVLASIAQPYFARPRSRAELRQACVALNAGFALLMALLVAGAQFAPGAVLWVLGPRYAGLRAEAAWMVAAGCLSAWSAAMYSLGSARGWVVPSSLTIPCGLGAIALTAVCVDVATVKGAFQINAAWSLAGLLLAAGWVGRELRR